ncbi:hypothetical protein I552_6989 [Mycobacterium xenopi 3993]|nr:hypothetical protein I552_6989 [Mycobacterium xenopi 3993]
MSPRHRQRERRRRHHPRTTRYGFTHHGTRPPARRTSHVAPMISAGHSR